MIKIPGIPTGGQVSRRYSTTGTDVVPSELAEVDQAGQGPRPFREADLISTRQAGAA